ncbi:MAG: hypothetical protein DMF01_07465 [Verrucomicrobia bacterium]|nr:MAG: hypothetical protein DMF01_07465 [Verrucomicrobiota bacterium]
MICYSFRLVVCKRILRNLLQRKKTEDSLPDNCEGFEAHLRGSPTWHWLPAQYVFNVKGAYSSKVRHRTDSPWRTWGSAPRKNRFPKTSAVSADQLRRSPQSHNIGLAEFNAVRVIGAWREG